MEHKFRNELWARRLASILSDSGARGWPAKNDSGPLTPNTVKENKRASMSSLRHKRKISDIRRAAVSKRYIVDDENNDTNAGADESFELEEAPYQLNTQRRLNFDDEFDGGGDGVECEAEEDGDMGELDEEVVEEEEEVKSSWTKDNPYGSMSSTDFYRKAGQAIVQFKAVSNGWHQQVDIAMHLLVFDKAVPCIDRRKMRIEIDFDKWKKKKDCLPTATMSGWQKLAAFRGAQNNPSELS